MRRILLVLALFFGALPAAAQVTTVSGTVTDPNGVPYAFGTIKAQLTNPGATVTLNNQQQCASGGFGSAPCQVPIQGTVGPLQLNGAGAFTVNLYDNTQILPSGTQWIFTVVISPGVPPPAGTGGQSFQVTLTISGATQNVSSNLSAAAPALTLRTARTTNFVDVTAPPNTVKPDARSFTCDTSSGGHLVKSAGLFLSTDVGKSIFAYVNGGTADAFPYTTVTAFIDASDITIAATIVTAAAGRTCFVGTDNTAALNAASASLVAGQSLYLPAGNYMVSSNILSNGILANVGACPNPNYEVAGEGMGVTTFIVPWFDIAGLGAVQPFIGSFTGQSCGFWHDFSVDNGLQAQVSSTWNALVAIPANRMERIRISNWDVTGGGGTGSCIGSPVDGTQFQNIETFGCAQGIAASWKGLIYFHPRVSAANIGMNLSDINGVVIGGIITGCPAIVNTFQSGVSAWTLSGVNAAPNSGCAALQNNGVTRTYIFGGSFGNAAANSTGIHVLTGGYVMATGANIASGGTGDGVQIDSGGTFEDGGANVFSATGAANIANSGTLLSKGGAMSLTPVALSSATSIGATTLCAAAACPAGLYKVSVYIDLTAACTTTGSYIVWVTYTDDQGVKSQQPIQIDGPGVTFASSTLALNTVTNYGSGVLIFHSTGAAAISYGSTASACGTGGPATGFFTPTIEKIG